MNLLLIVYTCSTSRFYILTKKMSPQRVNYMYIIDYINLDLKTKSFYATGTNGEGKCGTS